MCRLQLVVAALLLVVRCGLGTAARPQVSADRLGDVVFASVVFRHGDRAPIYTYPTDPYKDVERYWPRGPGQLTEVGDEGQYELGQFLRQRYDSVLPRLYHANHTLVRSTTLDRALLSAQNTLAGLYPAPCGNAHLVASQYVPVHSAELDKDSLMLPQWASCARIEQLVALVRRSPELRCVRRLTASVRNEVAKYAADNFSGFIYDTLFIQELYNLKLPSWTHAYYPSPLKDMILLDGFLAPVSTISLQRLTAGPLLRQVTQDVRAKMKGELQPDRLLHVYSGHDFNVIGVLHALGVYNGLVAPYSAAVLIELRNNTDGHFVTVWYRNSTEEGPHLLAVPGCEELCPVERFLQLVQPLVPDNWAAECADTSRPDDVRKGLLVPPAAIRPEWRKCFVKPS